MKINIGRTKAIGYHFSDGVLTHGDGRKIKEGETHEARQGRKKVRKICGSPCNVGLHASLTPHDAWNYVVGNTLSFVLVDEIDPKKGWNSNKFVGRTRTYLKVVKLTRNQVQELRSLNFSEDLFNNKALQFLAVG